MAMSTPSANDTQPAAVSPSTFAPFPGRQPSIRSVAREVPVGSRS